MYAGRARAQAVFAVCCPLSHERGQHIAYAASAHKRTRKPTVSRHTLAHTCIRVLSNPDGGVLMCNSRACHISIAIFFLHMVNAWVHSAQGRGQKHRERDRSQPCPFQHVMR